MPTSPHNKKYISNLLSSDTEVADTFRAEQIDAIARFTPVMMSFHVLVGGFLIWFFYGETSNTLLIAWGIGLIGAIAMNLETWFKFRSNPELRAHSDSINKMTVNATALSLIWGIAAITLFPISDLKQQLALACVMISMMSIGAFSLANVRQAALSYVTVFTICSLCAFLLTRDGFFIALSGFQGIWALAATVAIINHSVLFTERLVTRSIIKRQTMMMELFEKDLVETVGALRLELDKEGRMKSINRSFARQLGYGAAELNDTSLQDLLQEEASLDDDGSYLPPQDLFALFDRGIPFKDRIICFKGVDGSEYWRFSGRPSPKSDVGGVRWRCFVQDANLEIRTKLAERNNKEIGGTTGLPDMRSFEKKTYALLSHAAKQRFEFACISIRIENLNEIPKLLTNTSRGELVKKIGKQLQEAMAGPGFIARIGKDEFGLLCPLKASPEGLLVQLSASMGKGVELEGKSHVVQVAVGCAVAPQDSRSVSGIISAANTARKFASGDDASDWCIFNGSFDDELVLTRVNA